MISVKGHSMFRTVAIFALIAALVAAGVAKPAGGARTLANTRTEQGI